MPAETATRAYFDTSVLVKCFVREPGTAEAVRLVRRHGVVSSVLAPIELVGALRRQAASGGLTRLQREAARLRLRVERPRWTLLAIDAQVLARAETLVAAESIKTLDALHLASALVFQAETGRSWSFATGDAQQRRAAEALGLDVIFVG